ARDIVIRMSVYLTRALIVYYTGICLRTVNQILVHFNRTGSRSSLPRNRQLIGRRRILTYEDIQFLLGSIQQTPDLYLDELQSVLYERRGIHVSLSTIWRSL
ncbi:hypothetical protein BDV93DRAFT_411689, partial [Ceratobasidium sp. AG-I]